ncbi:MAG: hypothetical protein RLY14_1909 [Planctomycetota bacterium]|jgi:hypothetical protein
MNINRLHELIEAWSEGNLSEDQSLELNTVLRDSQDARALFNEATRMHGLLHTAADTLAMETAAQTNISRVSPEVSFFQTAIAWQNWLGLFVGLSIGIVGVSAVWAFATPAWIAVSRPIANLSNPSFEASADSIQHGFPERFGRWGGDTVEITPSSIAEPKHQSNVLRFVTALSDPLRPSKQALACDLFQLVDLRELRLQRQAEQEMSIELTASFLDDRANNSQPSVTFFCQLYLFRGEGLDMHQRWPEVISEAISSGSAETTTLGKSGWRDVTARCHFSSDADFAVIHVAARPNLRVPMPDRLFIDHVRLIAKTQPVLPIRLANESR